MNAVTRWVLRRFAPSYERADDPAVRLRIGLLEGWMSVVLNTLLFLFKGALGLFTGSVALLADAWHTLADSLTSLVVIVGFRMSNKPADEEHPFGHGRVESIAAVVIAVLLGVVAVEMLAASVRRLIAPKPVHAADWVIATLAATAILKELLARFSLELGRAIGSDALVADGWHHRSDVLATGLVVVAFIGVHWDLNWLDGAMGLGVACMIGWAAYETLHSAIGPLVGQRAPLEMYEEIERIARGIAGVRGVHDVLIHRYGLLNIVSLHVEVSASESAMHLHEISQRIEALVQKRYGGHAIVHVDPLNTDHKHYEEVRQIVAEAVAAREGAISFHDLRLVGGERFKVVFDVAPRGSVAPSFLESLQADVLARLRKRFPGVRLAMELEPIYFHNVAAKEEPTRRKG